MRLFEHFFKVLSLYLKARIRIRIRVKSRIRIRMKVKGRIRIRINVMRIRNNDSRTPSDFDVNTGNHIIQSYMLLTILPVSALFYLF